MKRYLGDQDITLGDHSLKIMEDILSRKTATKTMYKEYPKLMSPFVKFVEGIHTEGALSAKTKQLISVAISIICKCEECLAYHIRHAVGYGATKDEVMEAAFVAILMGGAPALIYTPLALEYTMEAIEYCSTHEEKDEKSDLTGE